MKSGADLWGMRVFERLKGLKNALTNHSLFLIIFVKNYGTIYC